MKVKNQASQTWIFDPLRRKWLVLSPEEWVRQHVVNYLVQIKKYPASRIALEKEIRLNDLSRRFDIVVYDSELQPLILVECKAPYVELNREVLEQVQRYNLVIKAPYFMITNGVSDLVLDSDNKVAELPEAAIHY